MLAGIYVYRQKNSYGETVGHIKIKVSETDKAYLLELLENTTRYDYDQFIRLFDTSTKARINKTNHGGTRHAIKVWSDNDFTIYPYQSGIPFWFTRVKLQKGV